MEPRKASSFLDLREPSTSFWVLSMLDSFLISYWFLMICADVRERMLVYSFQTLKIDTRSTTFFLKSLSFPSAVRFFSSISLSFALSLSFSLAIRFSLSYLLYWLLFRILSTVKLCFWVCYLTSSLLYSAIWLLSCRYRGIKNLFFYLMISSLLVTWWSSSKSPSS